MLEPSWVAAHTACSLVCPSSGSSPRTSLGLFAVGTLCEHPSLVRVKTECPPWPMALSACLPDPHIPFVHLEAVLFFYPWLFVKRFPVTDRTIFSECMWVFCFFLLPACLFWNGEVKHESPGCLCQPQYMELQCGSLSHYFPRLGAWAYTFMSTLFWWVFEWILWPRS